MKSIVALLVGAAVVVFFMKSMEHHGVIGIEAAPLPPGFDEPEELPSSPAILREGDTDSDGRVALDVTTEEAAAPRAPVLDLATKVRELQTKIDQLNKRIEWLEIELDLCGSEITKGPVGAWLAAIFVEERPDSETLHRMAEALRPYPVQLSPAEGLWIAERIQQDDWKAWGPTVDEALIAFLGPTRIAWEVGPDHLATLQAKWAEEGYFSTR